MIEAVQETSMTFDEFRALVAQTKSRHPVWFGLEMDRAAADAELQDLERQLGVRLPEEYRRFVQEYGGGYFALANVFSAQPGSSWNLLDINRREKLLGTGFVAVADNGAGDLYGFQCIEGVCHPEVWIHDHEVGAWRQTEFVNLLDFLHRKALTNP
jgi:hypothetical protein